MPIDDEREAAWEAWTPRLTDLRQDAPPYSEAFEAGWTAALRRTEVPEPSRDPGWSHPEAVYSPEVFMAIQGLLNEARGEPMHALRLAVSRQVSEPQGEPSDTEIEAAKSAINLVFYRADTREFGAGDWDRLYRDMADAALRAAGGVR